MPSKKITAMSQVATADIDRSTALMPYVDLTEALPANRNKKISIDQITGEYVSEGTLTSAQLLNIGFTAGAPVVVIPAPGVGYYIRIIRADVWLSFGTLAYAGGYGSLVLKHNAANKALFAFVRILESTVTRSEMGVLQDVVATTDTLMLENAAIEFTSSTGTSPTTGDSDIKYKIRYAIEKIVP